jgi:hypothetical protein
LEIGDPESDGAMGRRRRVQAGGLVFDQVNGPGGGSVEPVREVTSAKATIADTGPGNQKVVAPLQPGEWSMPVSDAKAGGVILGRFADPARQGGMSVEPSRLNWSRAAEALAKVGGTLADAAIRPPDQERRAAFLAQRTPVHVQGNTMEADRSERLAGVEQGRTMARERQRYVEPVEVQGRTQVDVADRALTGQKYVSDNSLAGVRDTNATTRTTTADTNRTRLAQQGMILRGTEVQTAGTLAGETVRAGAEKYRADKGLEGQGLIVGGQKYAADKSVEGQMHAAEQGLAGQRVLVEGQKYVADAPGRSAKELREIDARTAAELQQDAKGQGGLILPPGVQYVPGSTPVKVRQDGVSKMGKPVQREVFVDPRTNRPMSAPGGGAEDDPIIAASNAEIQRQSAEMAGGDRRTGFLNRKSRETVIAEQEEKIAERRGQLIQKQFPDAKLVNGRWIVERDGKRYAVGE